MTMTFWIALDVESSEVARGDYPLISGARVYPSLQAAKNAEGEANRFRTWGKEWDKREGGGVFRHTGSGGVEIIPVEL